MRSLVPGTGVVIKLVSVVSCLRLDVSSCFVTRSGTGLCPATCLSVLIFSMWIMFCVAFSHICGSVQS